MIGGGLGAVVRAWLTDVTKSKWSTSIPIATFNRQLDWKFSHWFNNWPLFT